MKARLCYYHDKQQLRFVAYEAQTLGALKALVRQASAYVTHVDVYLGEQPCRFKARIRRINGAFWWAQLERCFAEYHA